MPSTLQLSSESTFLFSFVSDAVKMISGTHFRSFTLKASFGECLFISTVAYRWQVVFELSSVDARPKRDSLDGTTFPDVEKFLPAS